MKLSAPIYRLKREAHQVKKSQGVTLAQALDAVARREGFQSWSHLQARRGLLLPRGYREVLGYCNPGDLVLVAGRPAHGKTSFAVGLMAQAVLERGVPCAYFSLESVRAQAQAMFARCDPGWRQRAGLYHLDLSDHICAGAIVEQTQSWLQEGSVVVVDYLQLLDQRRVTPPLQEQVEQLRAYASRRRCVVVFISQVSRAVEERQDKRPGLADVHLPNPLDLGLFHKKFFLYRERRVDGPVEVLLAQAAPHRFQVRWSQGRFC